MYVSDLNFSFSHNVYVMATKDFQISDFLFFFRIIQNSTVIDCQTGFRMNNFN